MYYDSRKAFKPGQAKQNIVAHKQPKTHACIPVSTVKVKDLNPKNKRKKRKPLHAGMYSPGELNRLVDSLVHPLAEKNATFILVDGALHAIIEGNPAESAKKFMKFSLPGLTRSLLDQQTKKKKKPPS